MTRSIKFGTSRAVADLTDGIILATVEIAAPVERVFKALTDSSEIVRWWGAPEAYRTTEWIADVRPQGRFRASGTTADGQAFSLHGEYLEVDPPRKLVHTWEPDWDKGHITKVAYRLDPIAGGTRVTLRHEGFAGHPESCTAHCAGWELVLGWLAEGAQGAEAAGQSAQAAVEKSYFLCKLLPPRPTFPADMSPAEADVMRAHVAYWQSHLQRGVAVAFGPVMDPNGAWGAGIIGVSNDAELRELQENDPAIRSGLGFRAEACAMPGAIVREWQS